MLSTKLKEAAGNSADATLYVDDVFSTYLYTGNGSTQTITNGIDLAGKGGLVWIKNRAIPGQSNADAHQLYDTTRGLYKTLHTNSTSAQETTPADTVTSFNSTGFSLGADTGYWGVNEPTYTFASWTFRKAAKFFDVVTYSGTGSARTIAHSLGVAPGMVIVKRTDTTGNWQVYSNGLTSAAYSIQLNLTNAQASAPTVWNSTAPTSSVFSVGTNADVNASGGTYVAYLFATLAGISKVGSYTGNGTTQTINCGFTGGARFFLVKATSTTGSWWVWDSARGITAGNDPALQLNSTAAEITTADAVDPYSPGITVNQEATCSINASGVSYIFLAIA